MSLGFSNPIVYCITEGDATAQNFAQEKEEIVKKVQKSGGSGISLFQIREKRLGADLLFDLVAAAVQAAGGNTKILVNSRFDIALAANAHGVHLPSDSIPTGRVRECVGKNFIVGISVHSLTEAQEASVNGADFAVFAPVFESPGKSEVRGVEVLRTICAAVAPFPVLALGGVDESNVGEVLSAGASGYAAIRYLNEKLRLESRNGS